MNTNHCSPRFGIGAGGPHTAGKRPGRLARLFLTLALLLSLLPSGAASAAEGDVDQTFLGANITGADGYAGGFVEQPDGKIIVTGSFYNIHGVPRGRIARLNTDGTLDTTFNGSIQGASHGIYTVRLLADGKLLIGGSFSNYNGTAHQGIARLNSNGTLDATFPTQVGRDVGGLPQSASVHAIALLPDGDILIAGNFNRVNGTPCSENIARLNADGSLDTGFMNGLAGANNPILTMEALEDGTILIAGAFSEVNGANRGHIARLNADGSVNTSFMNGLSGANDMVLSISPVYAGTLMGLYVGGFFTTINGANRPYVARLNADGSLNTGFLGTAGAGPNNNVRKVFLDGARVTMSGDFTSVSGTPRGYIARLYTNGGLDTDFMAGLNGANASVVTIKWATGGGYLVGGNFTQVHGAPRGRIAKLNLDGSLNGDFMRAGANAEVTAMALQADGRVVIGGKFDLVNSTPRNGLARLNADGSLDLQYMHAGYMTGPNGSIDAMVTRPDGRIFIGGGFTQVHDAEHNHIALLDSDGGVNADFNTIAGSGTNGPVFALAVQPDGKLLVGGHFDSAAGGTRRNLARLNTNGSLDTSFSDPAITRSDGGYAVVYSLALQADGKIVIVGEFDAVSGAARKNVARINANGTLDTAYLHNKSGADKMTRWVDLDPDGNAIIGGWFTDVNGQACQRVARLSKTDGSPDPNFMKDSSGLSNGVRVLAVQTDGEIIIGGEFETVNGQNRSHLARLNADGSLDEVFLQSTAGPAGRWVNALVIQPDDKVLVGGDFTSMNGYERGSVLRVLAESHPVDPEPPSYDVFLPGLWRAAN